MSHTHTHTSSIKGYALQMCAFVVYKVFGRFTDCLIREVTALPKICCEHHQIYLIISRTKMIKLTFEGLQLLPYA